MTTTPAMPRPICYAAINKQGDVTSTHKTRDSWRTVPLYTHTTLQAQPAAVSDEQIRHDANLPFVEDEQGAEWVTLSPAMFARAVRRVLALRPQSETYVSCRECSDCGHTGINDEHESDAACLHCGWSGPEPTQDKCPACDHEGAMCAACPKCSGRYRLIAEKHVPALRPQAVPMTLEATNDVGLVPVVIKPFTPAQRRRLWDNSPEIHKDATSITGFERIVSLTERAHGITSTSTKEQQR